jgi:hypothetical protein
MGVYRGVTQDNPTLNGGTIYGATIQLRTATAAQIADIENVLNTSGKAAGTIVFDTTNSKIKVATGANANSTWVDAGGTNAVTPS